MQTFGVEMVAQPEINHSTERTFMTSDSQFSITRAISTLSAAKQVAAKWVSSEISLAQMQSQLDAVTGNSTTTPPVVGQVEIASQAQRNHDGALGDWRAGLKELHQRSVQALNMAKTKFRNDPASLAVLSSLHAAGGSPDKILSEALAWESAWGQLAPTWSPTTTNTLAAFKLLRKQCAEDLQTAYTDADSANREAAGTLEQMCESLEDTNVSWYADATRIFPAGTPEGDMIRSSIPTTYTPPADKTATATSTAQSAPKTP
jgi:hypothetical protein